MDLTCIQCTKKLTPRSPGILCAYCDNHFHIACVRMSLEQLITFNEIPGAHYRCPTCTTILVTSKPDQGNKNRSNCASCRDVMSSVNELRADVRQLRDEIRVLKERTNDPALDVLAEINEYRSRERNIMVFGLAEGPERGEQRHHADWFRIGQLLRNLSPNLDTRVLYVVRCRNANGVPPQPVKVSFATRDDVLEVMRLKKYLSGPYAKVSITTDRTLRQRELEQKMNEELQNRIRGGEENLCIKFVHGNPVITKTGT